MDPLDDLFAALRVRSALMARIEGRGAWGLAKTGGETARYGLVARGRCLLWRRGTPDSWRRRTARRPYPGSAIPPVRAVRTTVFAAPWSVRAPKR